MSTVENTVNSGQIFDIIGQIWAMFRQIWAILLLFEAYVEYSFKTYVKNLKNKCHFLTDTVEKLTFLTYVKSFGSFGFDFC